MFGFRNFSNLMTGLFIYAVLSSLLFVTYLLSSVRPNTQPSADAVQESEVEAQDISQLIIQMKRLLRKSKENEDTQEISSKLYPSNYDHNDGVVMHDEHHHEFGTNNITSCEILNIIKSVDKTVNNLNSNLFCDEYAQSSDVVCRWFFLQIGLPEQGMCRRMSSDSKVPKIVYYVIFGVYTFKFWEYVSVMSAKKFIKPTAIYIIGDAHPQGYWWEQVLHDVTGIRFVYREKPSIGNWTIKWKHHMSDLVRLQVLLANGGIYLDTDMVIVRSLDPLLSYDITMGLIENGTGMGNALIAARRGSPFVREWYEAYTNYSGEEFYRNSLQNPRDMWIKNPRSIHLESDKLYRPNWFEADLLFKGNDYPWRENYAIHVWTNGNPVPKSPKDLVNLNTTIGQIFRHVLYDKG